MNRAPRKLLLLAAELVALQAKARELGLFTNDRELLECPHCGLLENVSFDNHLFTCRPESLNDDTGLRFVAVSGGRFRCPSCGAEVRGASPTARPPKKTKQTNRSKLRPRRGSSLGKPSRSCKSP